MIALSKAVKLKNDNYLDSTSIVHNKRKLSTILDKLLGKTTLNKLTVHNYLEYGWETNGLNQVFKKRRCCYIAFIC